MVEHNRTIDDSEILKPPSIEVTIEAHTKITRM